MTRRLTLLAAVCCTALGLAPAAQAITGATLRVKLTHEMAKAGPFAGAYVRDLTTGRVLYASKQSVGRMPASVQKLYTTSTALIRMGPDATLPTTVLGVGGLDTLGVWRGNLYLRGGGDPSLDSADIATLAHALAEQAGIVRVAGSIVGDESYLDSLRGSAHSKFAFDRDMGGALGALTVSYGFARDGAPAADAARRLAKRLRADGVAVDGRTSTGPTPADAVELVAVTSPPISELIRRTNVPSDNFYAEILLKDLGARFGGAGTTAAGIAIVRDQLATLGIHPRMVDGSGLSRSDRTTPRQVVKLLERMHALDVAPAFQASLAIAGRTGTIRDRMRRTAARDRCRAKTGTLIDVSALAGYCDAAGGHTIAFAFLMNATAIAHARRLQDHMTVAIARFDGP